MTLTTADLDRLDALERAASPSGFFASTVTNIETGKQTYTINGRGFAHIADVATHDDAVALAEFRNAAPSLLAQLREARALLAAVVAEGCLDTERYRTYGEARCRCCERPWVNHQHTPEGPCLWLDLQAHLAAAGEEIPR